MQLFLLQLIRRNLKIKWFVKYFYKINKLLPGKSNLSIYPEDYRSIGSGGTDPNRIISKTKNNLVLEKKKKNWPQLLEKCRNRFEKIYLFYLQK